MHPRWERLQQLLTEFQLLLASQVPRLQLHEGVGPGLPPQRAVLKQPGVYLLFDAASVLRYVGCAPCRPMITRVRSHLRAGGRLGYRPSYVDAVPFEWEWCFLAPALELYLIQKVECGRLVSGGERLLNAIGLTAGVREWFNLTFRNPHPPRGRDA